MHILNAVKNRILCAALRLLNSVHSKLPVSTLSYPTREWLLCARHRSRLTVCIPNSLSEFQHLDLDLNIFQTICSKMTAVAVTGFGRVCSPRRLGCLRSPPNLLSVV
jgi:hypothetical protein